MGESSQGSDGGDEARRHREIIAAFGIKALQGGDLDVLLTEACQHVSNGLGVEHAKILEYRPESDDLLVRAGIGWAEGVVGRATLGTDMASPPGRAFRSGEGVFISDFAEVPDFRLSELLRRHGVVSLVNVPIRSAGFTYGVLEADANARRRFTQDDRNFLMGFANLLAAAVQRCRADEERDRLLAELGDAKQAAEAAAASKSRMLAATSHDLKQPLQIILMCLHNLRAALADPAQRKHVERGLHAVEELDQALEYLLAVAQIESGTIEPRMAAVPLGPLLAKIVEEHEAAADRKGLALRLVPSRSHVRSDPELLRRILQNLISNAVKYTERGRILIGCRRRGRAIAIEVHDTGVGIPRDQLARIFDEFRRLDTRRSDGFGLGLAIVKRLAGLLGHPLAVHSRPGQGTCFSLEAPLAAKKAEDR